MLFSFASIDAIQNPADETRDEVTRIEISYQGSTMKQPAWRSYVRGQWYGDPLKGFGDPWWDCPYAKDVIDEG